MDRRGLEELVRQHQGLVDTIAVTYVRDPHVAEDLTQEVFLAAMKHIDGVRDPSRAQSWLGRIARNKSIDYLRSRRDVNIAPVENVAAPDGSPANDDQLAAVEKSLRALRDDYRQIVLLRYVEGLSYVQIGKIVGLTPTAVGEKLHRVWRQVIKLFKEKLNEL